MANPAALPHLPGLDGVRALAVFGVLGYHLDLQWAGGGFLGVEVFFTLSGFLITQLLAAELARRGRVDALAFAIARGKRLVPALVAGLLLTTVAVRLLRPVDAPGLRADAVASLLYAQNWHLVVAGVPYGAVFDHPSPLLHLWSLAVEGQLYVLWPLLFVGLLATWPRGWAAATAALMAGLSAVLMALQYDAENSGWAYYATDARASGFLVGAALALVWCPAQWSRPLTPAVRNGLDAVGMLALVALLVGFVHASEFDDLLYLHGGFLRTGLLTAVVVLAASREGSSVAALLSGRVLRWVGQRSYGIYLYHWPVFVLTRSDDGGPVLDLARLAATFVLAELSYRALEIPVRRSKLLVTRRTPAVAAVSAGVAAATLAGVLAATTPSIDTAGGSVTLASTGPLQTSAPPPTPVASPAPSSPAPTPAATAVPAPVAGPVLVVGDSIALSAAAALQSALGPGTTVEGEVGRQFSTGAAIVEDWVANNRGPVVVALGANGTVQARDVEAMVRATAGRRVVLVGVAVPRRWQNANNAVLSDAAARHAPDVVFLDWAQIVAAHPDVLGPDGVHPTPAGRDVFASAVAEAVRR